MQAFPLLEASEGVSLVAVRGLIAWLLVAELRLWSTDSAAVVHGLSCVTACRSSRSRDRTHVSCIGGWILYH